MAFPIVAAVNGSAENVGEFNHLIPFPTGIVSGHLLILSVVVSGAISDVTMPTGWTVIATGDAGARTRIAYRVADGTESGNVTVTTSAEIFHAGSIIRITGQHATSAPEAAIAIGTGTTWDAPALTPSWGAEDTLWLAIGGESNSTEALPAVPANYTSRRGDTAFNGASCLVTSRDLNAASENPPSAATSVNLEWSGTTVAIRPAAVAVGVVHPFAGGRTLYRVQPERWG